MRAFKSSSHRQYACASWATASSDESGSRHVRPNVPTLRALVHRIGFVPPLTTGCDCCHLL
eukprot:4258289-Prymnesium_polylepis.1